VFLHNISKEFVMGFVSNLLSRAAIASAKAEVVVSAKVAEMRPLVDKVVKEAQPLKGVGVAAGFIAKQAKAIGSQVAAGYKSVK
jgi:hypothetical protein